MGNRTPIRLHRCTISDPPERSPWAAGRQANPELLTLYRPMGQQPRVSLSPPNKIHHSLSISADCRGPVARIQLISAGAKSCPAAHFERSVSPSRAHAITSFLHPPRPAQWNVPETAHMPQGEPCTRLLLRGESMLRRQTRAKAFAWCKMPAPRLTGVGTTGSNSTWRALSTAFRSLGLACSCR